jgi:hypothetical protein
LDAGAAPLRLRLQLLQEVLCGEGGGGGGGAGNGLFYAGFCELLLVLGDFTVLGLEFQGLILNSLLQHRYLQ